MSDTGGPVRPGPDADGPEPAAPDGTGATSRNRPAWLVPAAVVAAVVVVAGIVVAVVVSRGGDADPAGTPVATPTIVGPVPTPTVTPAQRKDPTAFTAALPASVLQYAFTGEKPAAAWAKAGAVEAVTDTYSDGGTGTLVVDAGQFPTAKEATAFAKTLLDGDGTVDADAGLPAAGEVSAGGTKVGTFVIQDRGDGTGVAVWTNRTSVFRLVTAVEDVVNAYNAYPL
ncbi:hypothetical protein [Cellulomonas edaphi]|uniref:Uncharacterized protein n=1 Tax=Cellulomonas edaphi TaxID=3053468 RepID=A0ABT7S418_9CELL|nr:hypothetical protein [Cellulomons edaphi]MDM7830371.1 hypothetical protein [Cellulomons edaphi]